MVIIYTRKVPSFFASSSEKLLPNIAETQSVTNFVIHNKVINNAITKSINLKIIIIFIFFLIIICNAKVQKKSETTK